MGKYLDIARKFEARIREATDTPQRSSLPAPVQLAATEETLSSRSFLPRPLGQEDNPDAWDSWTPLFDWLIEYQPAHFYTVCDAEDAVNALERQGITSGQAYEEACATLLRRFETARRLRLQAGFKVWVE